MAREFCIIFLMVLAVLAASEKICFIGSEYNPNAGIQTRWFLPYGDPCECTAIRLAGVNRHTPSCLQAVPLKNITLSEDHAEIRSFFDCPSDSQSKSSEPVPLGLEDGTIGDQQMRASSTYSGYLPSKARLNNPNGCWIPEVNEDCWIEVDLGVVTMVTAIISQGSKNYPDYRVTKYEVMYGQSPDSSNYNYIRDSRSNIKKFNGNLDDATTPVINTLDEVVMAMCLRIVPIAWFSVGPGLRLELLGWRD